MIVAAITRRWPDSSGRDFAIGRTLLAADRDAALAALEDAARSPPRARAARKLIAIMLSDGDSAARTRAIAIARELVAQDPLHWAGHAALGVVLLNDQRLDEAIEALSEALRLAPNDGSSHRAMGMALFKKRRIEEALASARAAVRVNPGAYQSWAWLGFVLLERGEFEEAVASYERAVELNPDSAFCISNLGRAYVGNGDFVKGLDRLRQGQRIGSREEGSQEASKHWIAEAETRLRMENRLAEVRSGAGEPANAEEKLGLARLVCAPKRLFAEAARLYAEAFEIDPSFKSQRDPLYLLEAARCATVAGLGKGRDAPADAGERARLRGCARAWLEEDVAGVEGLVEQNPDRRAAAAAMIKPWTLEGALAPVRPPVDPDSMTEAEADQWRRLWERCSRLLAEPGASRPSVSR
jgi:tetratricopeptide (TPR) repeat protein